MNKWFMRVCGLTGLITSIPGFILMIMIAVGLAILIKIRCGDSMLHTLFDDDGLIDTVLDLYTPVMNLIIYGRL